MEIREFMHLHISINPYCKSPLNLVYYSTMRTTLDIPDTMYRRIKTRTAQEGNTVRGITLVLYAQWLGEEKKSEIADSSALKSSRKRPAWFACTEVNPSLKHDMTSIRRSIARHYGE